MAYTPIATDSAEPVVSQKVSTAAQEFRTLKAKIVADNANQRLGVLEAAMAAIQAGAFATDTVDAVLNKIGVLFVFGLPDWTDITTQLQAAANAGGSWIIPSGKFEATSVSLTTSVVLDGSGDSTHIRRKANTDTTGPNAATAMLFKVSTHGVTAVLRNMKLDGNEANQAEVEAYGYLAGFANVVGTAGSKLQLNCENITFIDATQACIRADGSTTSEGLEILNVTTCSFINGRSGIAAGTIETISSSGYGPDYITLTDKVYANILGNSFVFTNTLADNRFGRTAIRITFDVNTTNADGSRAYISGNYFKGCGRGERGTPMVLTGGTGTVAAYIVPITLTGTAIATIALLYGGIGYTAGDVLTAPTGGATFTVGTVDTQGKITALSVTTGGTGYSLPPRPVNDVGVVDAYARGRELRISNNLFEDSVGTPIRGKTSCDLVTIHNNLIDDCGINPAINIGPNSYIEQEGKISISSNIIRRCGVYGIAVVGNAGAAGDGTNIRPYVQSVILQGNIITEVSSWNAQLNPASSDAIRVRNFRGLTVANNIVFETDGRGIYLLGQGGAYSAAYLKVLGNLVESAYGNSYEASVVTGSATFSHNSAVGGAGRGFSVEATSGEGGVLKFIDNSVDGAYDYAFYSRYWDSVICTANDQQTVNGLSRGIYLQDTQVEALVNNNVSSGVTSPLFGGGVAQSIVRDFQNSWNPKHIYGTAAPTVGTWSVGDSVSNTNPSELGTVGAKYVIEGWVCTVAGTPGTWLQRRQLTGN